MPKAEFGTPKWIANQWKIKGLQRLKWYCQMCEKQCRDENGFKCHRMSEGHQRQMQIFCENPDKFMDEFSRDFERAYMKLLSTRYCRTRVHANQVYQEVISDKQHVHMNATVWVTLTEFVLYLRSKGKCEAEHTPKGWFITYIDQKEVERKKLEDKRKKKELSEDERKLKKIEELISSAKDAGSFSKSTEYTGIQRKDGKTVKFGVKPLPSSALTSSRSASSSIDSSDASSPLLSPPCTTSSSSSSTPSSSSVESTSSSSFSAPSTSSSAPSTSSSAPPAPSEAKKPFNVLKEAFKQHKRDKDGIKQQIELKEEITAGVKQEKGMFVPPSSLPSLQSTRLDCESRPCDSARPGKDNHDRYCHSIKRRWSSEDDQYHAVKEEVSYKKVHLGSDSNKADESKHDNGRANSDHIEGRTTEIVNSPWIFLHLIVKVMDEKLEGGKYFRKKGEIISIDEKRLVAKVKMLESSKTVELHQKNLETVIPKIGGFVRIVKGKWKNRIARLDEVNLDEYCASVTIEDGDSRRRIEGLQYEQICKTNETEY